MNNVKTAFAAVLAWADGNPRKGFAAAFGLGFVIGWIV
jgi:hypothetical protein